MEVERRMRFLVIENSMPRNAISASTFPGILDATPSLHAGYRCCAACAFAHLCTSFPNSRRGEACAKDNKVYRVIIPYGKMLGQLCQGCFQFPRGFGAFSTCFIT